MATLTSPFAVAQENTVTLEGLVWFDRDADGVVDPGEPPLADGRGVDVYDVSDKSRPIGQFRTDANGRYRATGLPDVPLAIYNYSTELYEATTPATYNPVRGGGTFDFGFRGGTVRGSSFEDTNRDGVRQGNEEDVPGAPTVRLIHGVVDVKPATRGVDGEYEFTDVPVGDQVTIVGDDAPELKLAPAVTEYDVDPATRAKKVVVRAGETTRVDVRYTHLDADFVAGTPRLEPARDTYRVGDVVTFVVPVTNRGEASDIPDMVVFGSTPEFVAAGDGVSVVTPGQDFRLSERMAVGATVDVRLTYRLDDPAFGRFHLFVRPISALAHKETNVDDNHAIVPLKYTTGEQPPTTTPPTTAPVTTTTTTVPAVARVSGDGSGLASTGATPLPWLAIGGLLLGAGALALLAARGRRRA
ncbi:hypothetical protein IOD16_35755 [Saccharothrix sp. 6-C]|uniref:hypothetical protein n=1 Tax=Saccharothrix sp. 6-C TaxID=2781735 RepID=UPI0019172383|nr:hypothetical protein [Saccharothrix sp. 6-C]QQQ76319.1 hypothetical protein IOD16_35755 [Saccharothrix sp. 6-C]